MTGVLSSTSAEAACQACEPDGCRGGTMLVVPVRLPPQADRKSWLSMRANGEVDQNEGEEDAKNHSNDVSLTASIPGFAKLAHDDLDDPSDRGRVYPQHVLETVFANRWTRSNARGDDVWHLHGQKGEDSIPVLAVEIWRYADSTFREQIDRAHGRWLRGRDAIAVIHLDGPLSNNQFRWVTSRASNNSVSKEINRHLAPFAYVVPERVRARIVQAERQRQPTSRVWRRASGSQADAGTACDNSTTDSANPPTPRAVPPKRRRKRDDWNLMMQKRVTSTRATPSEQFASSAGQQPVSGSPIPLEDRTLAEAAEMPFVVVFGPGPATVDAACGRLHRLAPAIRTDEYDEAVLAHARRGAVVFPDAMAISYEGQAGRHPYVPANRTCWAMRTFLTDAVILRCAQRLYFEDASTRLRAVDATTHPAEALGLHRDILQHRARLWWPRLAREPWVDVIDRRLAEVWNLPEIAQETFEETDQLAAEADQELTRRLTWFLAALAFFTLAAQVPAALRSESVLEFGLLSASILLVLALLVWVIRFPRRARRRSR